MEKQEIADRVHSKRATMSAALGIDKKDADELRALVQCVRLHFLFTLTLTLTLALLLLFCPQVLTLAARANVTHTLVEMLNEEAEAAWDKLAAQAGEAGAAPPAKPEPVAWPEEGEEAGAYERPGEQTVRVCVSAYQLTMSTTALRHATSPQRRRKRGRSWQTQSRRRRRWRQTLSGWRGMRRRTLDRRMSGGPCMSGASKQPSPST